MYVERKRETEEIEQPLGCGYGTGYLAFCPVFHFLAFCPLAFCLDTVSYITWCS